MTLTFSIENKKFNISDNFDKINSFTVKSSPRDYNVSVIQSENPCAKPEKMLKMGSNNILFVDENVYNLYFKDLNYNPDKIYIAHASEEFKTIDGVLDLVKFLEKNEFTKSDKLIAVGGGIIEDVAAFTGAVYKRGIPWIYYPTTLLSMCDSCIGGKTGINYNNVKNQLALFSAPREVIIDISFLKTLSDFDIKSGMGEILKLLITGGKIFTDIYEKEVTKGIVNSFLNYKSLILSSLAVKKAVIEADEFEFNYRKSLNYGHTFGHAIESLSNYKIPHGQAVIIGLIIANKIALDLGLLEKNDFELCKRLSNELLGDSVIKEVNLTGLDKLLKKDKKTEGSFMNLVLITKLGDTIFKKIEINDSLLNKVQNIIDKEFL